MHDVNENHSFCEPLFGDEVIIQTEDLNLEWHGDLVVLTDGWQTDYIIFYDHKPQWVCDGTFDIPEIIEDKLWFMAGFHYARARMQKENTEDKS